MKDESEYPVGFKGSSYQGFILFLSLLSIVNIIFLVFPALNPDATQVVFVVDLFQSFVFMLDFLFIVFFFIILLVEVSAILVLDAERTARVQTSGRRETHSGGRMLQSRRWATAINTLSPHRDGLWGSSS